MATNCMTSYKYFACIHMETSQQHCMFLGKIIMCIWLGLHWKMDMNVKNRSILLGRHIVNGDMIQCLIPLMFAFILKISVWNCHNMSINGSFLCVCQTIWILKGIHSCFYGNLEIIKKIALLPWQPISRLILKKSAIYQKFSICNVHFWLL